MVNDQQRRRVEIMDELEEIAERRRADNARRDALLAEARGLGLTYRALGIPLGMTGEGVRKNLERRGLR